MKLLLTLVLSVVVNLLYAQTYLTQGDDCYNKKDYKCAYENYIKGHEAGLKANKDILFYRIGYSLRQLGEREAAKRWQHLSLAEKISGSAYWELGINHYVTKKYDSATQYYTKAYGIIQTEENKFDIAYWNAYAYYNLSRYKDALTWVDTCLLYDDEAADVYLLSGEIASKQKNYSLAETSYMAVLELTKDSALLLDALNGLGHLKYQQKLYREAIPYYRNAKRYGPGQTNPWAYIGDSYRLSDGIDSAEYYYKLVIDAQMSRPGKTDSIYIARVAGVAIAMRLQAKKDTAKAMLLVPTLLRYNPKHTDAKNYLDLLFVRNDIKTLETVLPLFLAARYPRGGLLTLPSEEAAYHKRMGDLYRDAKQNQQAIRSYNTAFGLHPANVDPFVSILRILITEKKYKEASDSIQLKLTQIPAAYRTPVLLVQAELATIKKDTAAAAVIYKDIIRNTPAYSSANYPAHFYLGTMALQRKDSAQCGTYWDKIASQALYERKEMAFPVLVFVGMRTYKSAATVYAFESAARYLDRAVVHDSTFSSVRLYAAMANLNSSKLPAAKKHLDQLIVPYQKFKDTLAIVYRTLGYIEIKNFMGPRYETGLNYYREAQKANPKDSTITMDIGTIYFDKKDYTKAAETFAVYATQVKSKNNKAAAHYYQALCYYENKQHEQAKTQIARCLELVPEHTEAKNLKAKIEKPTG